MSIAMGGLGPTAFGLQAPSKPMTAAEKTAHDKKMREQAEAAARAKAERDLPELRKQAEESASAAAKADAAAAKVPPLSPAENWSRQWHAAGWAARAAADKAKHARDAHEAALRAVQTKELREFRDRVAADLRTKTEFFQDLYGRRGASLTLNSDIAATEERIKLLKRVEIETVQAFRLPAEEQRQLVQRLRVELAL